MKKKNEKKKHKKFINIKNIINKCYNAVINKL